MQFVDECTIYIKAGDGGNGVVSWRREAHYPEGGPWGGDGGNGGDAIIIGDHNINTLFDLRNKKNIFAPSGENGQTKMASGKNGEPVYIKVPLGTSVYQADNNELIVDILKSGQTHTICVGGRGGHGNAYFKSSQNKAPTLYENGDLGEEARVFLKLKYIADVGLVGLPNAGKSTFIGQISNAKPKVANYQFTTLTPVLGITDVGGTKITFADIPGLIEGAAEGRGLGHEFLKHIERSQILIHLISLNPIDNDCVVNAYETINNELKKYNNALLNKTIFIAANKCDVKEFSENYKKLSSHIKNRKIYQISAKNKIGIAELLNDICAAYVLFKKKNDEKLSELKTSTKIIELKQQIDHTKNLQIVQISDDTWEVKSDFLKYWSHKIKLNTKDNIIRFNQKMSTIKVEQKAKEAGAKKGDTLLIYGNEMTVE